GPRRRASAECVCRSPTLYLLCSRGVLLCRETAAGRMPSLEQRRRLPTAKKPLAREAFCQLLAAAEQLLNFARQIGRPFFETFTHLVSGKPADFYVLAGLCHHPANKVGDGDVLIFDKRLIHQADLLIELADPVLDYLLKDVVWFVGVFWIGLRLFEGNLAFLV